MKHFLSFLIIISIVGCGAPPTSSLPAVPTASTSTLQPIAMLPSPTPNLAQTVVAKRRPRQQGALRSPDGRWRADVLVYDCVATSAEAQNAYDELKLIALPSGIEKVADTQFQTCGGLGAGGLEGLFWSPNSRYFYYTNAREGVPDGCGFWQPPFIRLNLTTWEIANLGGGTLSSDKTKLATWQNNEVVVWDINEGEIARALAVASGAVSGPIAWAPNNQSLVYLQTTRYCAHVGETYVVRLDLSAFRNVLLLKQDAPGFASIKWEQSEELRLFAENGREWRYNFVTKELTPQSAVQHKTRVSPTRSP